MGDNTGGKYDPSESSVVSGGGMPPVGVLCLELFGDMTAEAAFPQSLPLLPTAFSGDSSLLDLVALGLFIIK